MKQATGLPEMLLYDKTVSRAAKFIYMVAAVYHPQSIGALARQSGVSKASASCLCNQLAKAGWIHKVKVDSRIVPVPAVPHAIQDQMIRELHEGFSAAQFKGEYLLRKWLEYLMETDDFIIHARLPELRNPSTEEPLELDIYIPSLKIAFEFHGPQHFGPTKAFPDVKKFKELQVRDYVKRCLCQDQGIRLVIITADDLKYETIKARIPREHLASGLNVEGPYVKELDRLSASYRSGLIRTMARERVSRTS